MSQRRGCQWLAGDRWVGTVAEHSVAEVKRRSGFRQGGPLSGMLFPVAVDLVIRHSLEKATFSVAVALMKVALHLSEPVRLSGFLHFVSGLRLRPYKRVLIPLWGGTFDAERGLADSLLTLSGICSAFSARCLGLQVGPRVSADLWGAVGPNFSRERLTSPPPARPC